MTLVRRIRIAFVGLAVLGPFALGAAPHLAMASAPSCSGIASTSFSITQMTPTHGAAGTTITFQGQSSFPLTSSFQNGGTVYFNNSSGSPAVTAPMQNATQTSFTVQAPTAYSGTVYVCISGNTYPAVAAGSYYYPPSATGIGPNPAHEGSTITVSGANFVANKTTVTLGSGCGTVGASVASLTSLTVAVPKAYCAGQILVNVSESDGSYSFPAAPGPSLGIAPTISGVGPASLYPGQQATITGTGFAAGVTSVKLGSDSAGGSVQNDGTVLATVPQSTTQDSITSVQLTTNSGSASWSGQIAVVPHLDSVSPSSASDGSTITISGEGFGSNPVTVTLGGQGLQVGGWGPTSVTAAIPQGAVPGQLALTRGDDNAGAVNQLGFTLQPVISGVSPSSSQPGGVVVIQGSTFGPSQGSGYVSFGGVKATGYYLWSDSALEVAVPSGASSGKLALATGYGQNVTWGQTFTVPAAASGSSSSGGTGSTFGGGGGSTGSGSFKPNYGFLPLPAAPNPIQLHMIASTTRTKPGGSVDLTATLQLNGKPIAGAPVTFQITDSPGTDAQLSAAKGVTAPDGTVHVTLVTSKKAGETVVVATSGAFSDQMRILTYSPAASTNLAPRTVITSSNLDPHVLIPFIGALVLAVLLLLGAVVLQWRLHRRAAIPVPAAAADAVAVAAPEPAARPKRKRAPKAKPAEGAAPATVEPPQAEAPQVLATAVGAEDMPSVGPADLPGDAIAPVIPLRKPGAARGGGGITRTRGTRSRAAKGDPPT